MKYLYLLIAACFLFCAAHAQTNCSVIKATAYFTVQQPGNIARDENGRTIKPVLLKERFIYIATSCNSKPVVSLLTYGKAAVKATVERVPGSNVILAKDESGKNISFKAAKGACIWKIYAGQNEEIVTEEGKPAIYLKVLLNKKTAAIRIYAETLLPSPDRP